MTSSVPSSSATRALAEATALAVSHDDVAGVLVALLGECAQALGIDAVGALVVSGRGDLELLSSTRHDVTHLEVYQVQQDRGPCVEVARTGLRTSLPTPDALVDRWDDVGRAIVDGGFRAVHAVPLRWQGDSFGTLNAFSIHPRSLGDDEFGLLQAFADVASLVIVAPPRGATGAVSDRIAAALHGRAVIERAKGALAYTDDLSLAAAYAELLRRGREAGHSLTAAAEQVLRDVVRDRRSS